MNNSAKAMDYANILFQVAVENNDETAVLYELNNLVNMRLKEVNKLLNVPIISKETKLNLIDTLKEFSFHPMVLNFMKILADRGDFSVFSEVIEEYKGLYQQKENIQVVKVYTAQKITAENTDVLVKELEEKLNKFVVLTSVVDPTLIGGIKIEYDGKEVNNTIKKHLNDFINRIARS